MIVSKRKYGILNIWNILDKTLFGLFCLKAFIHICSVLELILANSLYIFIFGVYTSLYSFISTYPLYALLWFLTRRLNPNPITRPYMTRKLFSLMLICDLVIGLMFLAARER